MHFISYELFCQKRMWILNCLFIIFSNVCFQQTHTKKITLKPSKIIRILYWTPFNTAPILGSDNLRGCPKKCFFERTSSPAEFRTFDAVIFHGPDCLNNKNFIYQAAALRTPKQKFIFLSDQSSHNYPICDEAFDDFFNLTWTYKLDSDILYRYFVIKDKKGVIIGPQQEMHWLKDENMMPTTQNIKKMLSLKSNPIAWLSRTRTTLSQREDYIENLEKALLKGANKLTINVFGRFGVQCDYENNKLIPSCWELIEDNYYFYLAFENSFSEDYVTEKVLHPLKHYTVPIVFGAANYTRFLPDGSYLNAMDLTPKELAIKIKEIINDKASYQEFFKWHNYYSYHDPLESPATSHLCVLCQRLHDNYLKRNQIYDNFRQWWNEPGTCQ